MAIYRTASQTISEMREYAGFTPPEQFFIARSLEIGRECRPRGSAPGQAPGEAEETGQIVATCRQVQRSGYLELAALRGTFAADLPLTSLDTFFAALVRVTALDLARGAIASFNAYRFLYERLLGAAVRPYLPSAFCAAAALPQIDPARRKQLLASVSELVVATTGWSDREPIFTPCRVLDEPDCGQ